MPNIRRFLPVADDRYMVLSNPEIQEYIQILSPHKIGKEQLWFLDAMDFTASILMGYMNTSIDDLSASVTASLATKAPLTGEGTSGTWPISITGNAATATSSGSSTTAASADKLTTARLINNTAFDGTANITTTRWGTSRTVTIGTTGKAVDGSVNVGWTLTEIGAAPTIHTHAAADITSGTFANARIAAGNVTQHQAALSIGWGQLTSIPAFASRWPTWTEVTEKPTTFTPSAHTHAWADITSGKPTTLAGYGITDAVNTFGAQTVAGVKKFSSQLEETNTFPLMGMSPGDLGRQAYFGGWGDTARMVVYQSAGSANTKALTAHYTFGLLWDNQEVWHAGNFTPANKADDSAVVHIAGAEDITGAKKFTNQTTIFGDGIGAAQILIRPLAGSVGDIIYTEGTNNRWLLRKLSSADNDYTVYSYDDAGISTLQARWSRSTGVLNFTNTPTVSANNIWHAGNAPISVADSADTLVKRNGSADIYARLFRSTFGNQSTISGAMAFRVNNSTDNYIRFCSDTGAIRNFLDAASLGSAETFNSVKTFAPGGGGFASIGNFHSMRIGDRPGADGNAILLLNPLGVQGGMGIHYQESTSTYRIHDWGTAAAPVRWTMHRTTGDVTMTGGFTNNVAFQSGLNFGSQIVASATDLSKHIALWGSTYGFSITNNTLNLVAGSAVYTFGSDGTFNAAGNIGSNSTAYFGNSKEMFRYSDSWLRLNPVNAFSNGIYCGTGVLRTDGQFQVGTSGSNFLVSGNVITTGGSIVAGSTIRGRLVTTTRNAATTLNDTYVNTVVEKNNTTAYTYTLAASAGAQGDVITVINSGTAGNITIARAAGVALYKGGTDANLTISPGTSANLYRSATTNRWIAL